MNRLKLLAASAGTSLLFSAGCSPHEQVHALSSPVHLPQPETAPTPTSLTRNQYLAQFALQMEQAFEAQARLGSATVAHLEGLCPVIAFKRPGETQKAIIVVADPLELSSLDPTTHESVSVVAAYDQATDSFVYGPARAVRHIGKRTLSYTLRGSTKEINITPGTHPKLADVRVSWLPDGQGVVNGVGRPVMDTIEEGYLGGRLSGYATDQTLRETCRVSLQAAVAAPRHATT